MHSSPCHRQASLHTPHYYHSHLLLKCIVILDYTWTFPMWSTVVEILSLPPSNLSKICNIYNYLKKVLYPSESNLKQKCSMYSQINGSALPQDLSAYLSALQSIAPFAQLSPIYSVLNPMALPPPWPLLPKADISEGTQLPKVDTRRGTNFNPDWVIL